ncbi:hypothetical protein EXS74_03760, partial [Candidatus Woesearchaeota archaeon]|nr:hypothetical protein [Candidatus Woesearchaeota archaeon]
KERIDRGGRIEEDPAVTILKDTLGALAHVHEKGIYHRDLKPSNILFDGTGAYLIDFNVSKRGNGRSQSEIHRQRSFI